MERSMERHHCHTTTATPQPHHSHTTARTLGRSCQLLSFKHSVALLDLVHEILGRCEIAARRSCADKALFVLAMMVERAPGAQEAERDRDTVRQLDGGRERHKDTERQ